MPAERRTTLTRRRHDMASVKSRGPNRWLLVWRAVDAATGQMAQRARMFSGPRADAVRTANEAEGAERREPVTSAHGLTLARYLEDWQAWRVTAGNVSVKTTYRDGQHAKVIVELIGDRLLTRLSARDLDQLVAGLRQRGYAAATIANTFACVRKALHQARKWSLIAGAPWEGATAPPLPLTSPDPPSVAETLKLAELLAADQPVASVLVHTMLASGARKSELLALNWSDVDLNRGAIAVAKALWEAGGAYGLKPEPKNAASRRSIALPTDCIARLKAHKAWIRERQVASGRTWNPDDLVFPAYHGGLWRPSRATAIVAQVARKHGLRTGLHNRRHAHAVLLLESQVPVKVVADRLGHADPTMTMRIYQHVTEQAAQLAVAALDRGLANASAASVEAMRGSSAQGEFVDSRVDSEAPAGRNNL
jgi:integrase